MYVKINYDIMGDRLYKQGEVINAKDWLNLETIIKCGDVTPILKNAKVWTCDHCTTTFASQEALDVHSCSKNKPKLGGK